MLIPEPVVASFSGGLSLLVASCDASARPITARGVGLRAWPDNAGLTLFLPQATAGAVVANLAPRPLVALVLSRPNDYHTVQLKGAATGVREARDEERAIVSSFMDAFGTLVEDLGVPRELWQRVDCWPCFAVDVQVSEVFLQTPGPGAGSSLEEPRP